jgi:hypothetical protein
MTPCLGTTNTAHPFSFTLIRTRTRTKFLLKVHEQKNLQKYLFINFKF